MRNVGILGVAFYVPPIVLTNADLIARYGPFYSSSGRNVDGDSIFDKTKIRERHVVVGEDNSDLALQAAENILRATNVSPNEVDCFIVASSTSSLLFPSTACLLHGKLRGESNPVNLLPAFDILAACSGSVYALIIAHALVSSRTCNKVLVIGSEVLSRLCRWKFRGNETIEGQKQKGDWETSVLFGDGAGGVLIGEVEEGRGFLSFDWCANGSLADIARSDGFGTQFPGLRSVEPQMHLSGYQMYREAIPAMTNAAVSVVEKAGIRWEDVKMVALHQANGRMREQIDAQLQAKGLPPGRVPSNIDRYGNTSTASPFILLAEREASGELQRGDYIVISVAGGGLTWAACLLRW